MRAALERETELFVDSVLRGGGSVLELLTAKHTFVNERLAKHYGIPNVQGSYFRRVELGEASRRSGLLGQGSILTVTSYAARTSPVLRGKYVLDNLLASPPPPPPPDVPSLATEDASDGAPLNLREAMIRHRADPVCAGCHAKMDPIGFALEHFDAVGRWRDEDAGAPIDAKSELPDGSVIDGPEGVQALLTGRPELFVSALTEKLMMYALGRNVQYYDAPAVRAVVRAAASRNYEFSAIVEGVVASVPFQMRAGRLQPRQRLPRRGDRDGRGRAMTFKPVTYLRQKALPRRTFLRGAGATLALPLLDAMVPAFAADRAPWTPRLGFVYVGNGIVHKTFKPSRHGHGVRAFARAAAARTAARAPHRHQRSRPRASQQLRRRHGRPSARVGRLAHAVCTLTIERSPASR